MQYEPPRQAQSLDDGAAGDMSGASEPSTPSLPIVAMQDFLLALTDPSTQMNVSPWHRSMPPFFPLHGVFSADAAPASKKTPATINHLMPPSC